MTFLTKSFCKKNQIDEISLIDNRYVISLFDSIFEIEEEWSSVAEGKDIFFSVEFLRVLEEYPASNIKPYYGLVKEKNVIVGIVYFQGKYVKLKENLRKSGIEPKNVIEKLNEKIKFAAVCCINFHTIVCGNLLLTGNYGFCFKESIDRDQQFRVVIKATDRLTEYLQKQGIKPGLVLIKDFFTQDTPATGEYHSGFTRFTVQPKMILNLKSDWKSFEDYLEGMKSKYRVRARKALQRADSITKHIFSADQIREHRGTIHALYKNVSDQAEFNAFLLHEKYFENLQEALGKNMIFTTYWRQGKMVAFFTSIKNYDVLDAHFLGYDPTENIEFQLYLNMLFDLIREGIDKRVTKVDLSRTAVEIKSTVGAIPHDMYLYLKHNNKLLNRAVETVLGFVKPEEDYIIRSPFREEV